MVWFLIVQGQRRCNVQEFETFGFFGGIMSVIFTFASKWVRWYRVLRYAKAFSFAASVRYGLWLARS